MPDGTELLNYDLNGSCLQFGLRELYILSNAEWLAFSALKAHQNLTGSQLKLCADFDNLARWQVEKRCGID
jgi:hypothetical protein